MENKINIAELLKDCPTGMELDCAMYDDCKFLDVDTVSDTYLIRINTPCGIKYLDKHGCYSINHKSKCVIFPKGKTTWNGFVPPCKFKDGDIIYVKSAYKWVAIYKESNGDDLHKYVGIRVLGDVFVNDCNPLCYKGDIREIRYATKEERQKLFNAIKDNGYKWNAETKTLEKLIEPKFKVGDRLIWLTNPQIEQDYYIKSIEKNRYVMSDGGFLLFTDQDAFAKNKFDINTLKPFESRVLMRESNNDCWRPAIYGYKNSINKRFYAIAGGAYLQCIPYEGNKHLIGITEDCDEYYKNW